MSQKRLHPKQRIEDILLSSSLIQKLMSRANDIALPDWYLCAGCLNQTVWNSLLELPERHGIGDIDLIYFDGSDLTEHAEAKASERIKALFEDINIPFDVKNEARVHLWYENRFGKAIEPYLSTTDAVASFPTTATAIAAKPTDTSLSLIAPFGLDDLLNLIVRPNKAIVTRDVYEAKIEKWQRYWPTLTYLDW